MIYTAIAAHRSEYPDPIVLRQGDALIVGERYAGPEGWDDWYFCSTPAHSGGWVPAQVIDRQADGSGRATEDYTARELDVDVDDTLVGGRVLNGWVWCRRASPPGEGWVPLLAVQAVPA